MNGKLRNVGTFSAGLAMVAMLGCNPRYVVHGGTMEPPLELAADRDDFDDALLPLVAKSANAVAAVEDVTHKRRVGKALGWSGAGAMVLGVVLMPVANSQQCDPSGACSSSPPLLLDAAIGLLAAGIGMAIAGEIIRQDDAPYRAVLTEYNRDFPATPLWCHRLGVEMPRAPPPRGRAAADSDSARAPAQDDAPVQDDAPAPRAAKKRHHH